MSKKRFTTRIFNEETYPTTEFLDNDKMMNDNEIVTLLNEQHEIIQQLQKNNNALIRFLENQSIIIQKLHSKLLEYQLKEPIVLTKEDLEIMGKAISYYSH